MGSKETDVIEWFKCSQELQEARKVYKGEKIPGYS
jgi:hypothetical protein